jgi:plastocyanin
VTASAHGTRTARHLTLALDGLNRPSVRVVEQALAQVPGVVRVYVNLDTEMAYVEYAPTLCRPEQLTATLSAICRSVDGGDATTMPLPVIEDQPPRTQAELLTQTDDPCCAPPRPAGTASAAGGGRGSLPFAWRLGAFGLIALVVISLGVWLALPHGAAADAAYSVDMSMAGFAPNTLTIQAHAPATVRLTNVDSPFHGITNGALHQFAIDELQLDIKLDARQSQVITLPALPPGTYTYYCDVCCGGKANKTMRGTLIVQ